MKFFFNKKQNQGSSKLYLFKLKYNKKGYNVYGIYNPQREVLVVNYKLLLRYIKCGVSLSKKAMLILPSLNKRFC